MSKYLAHRVQVAFDRCKSFPEAGVENGYFRVRGDAYMALIELRNLAPEIVLALSAVTNSSHYCPHGSEEPAAESCQKNKER